MTTPQVEPWNRKYPDTVKGVRQMMQDNSDIPANVLQQAAVYPDPYVDGVWKFEWRPPVGGYRAAIAYLAGYKGPSGQVRDTNDFEVEEDF